MNGWEAGDRYAPEGGSKHWTRVEVLDSRLPARIIRAVFLVL